MNIDVLRENMLFPLLKKGDHVIVSRIGAYNMTQWLQFITLRPKIILIDVESKTHVIRENESLELFKNLEKTPLHLEKFKLG